MTRIAVGTGSPNRLPYVEPWLEHTDGLEEILIPKQVSEKGFKTLTSAFMNKGSSLPMER